MFKLTTIQNIQNFSRRGRGGFTLLELLITVAIVIILTTIVMPGFSELYQKNRITTQTNDFNTAISLARSEAIKRGRPVCLVRANTYWEQGYWVFIDKSPTTNLASDSNVCKAELPLGQNTVTSTTECRQVDSTCNIQIYSALTGGNTLRTSSGAANGPYQKWLRFNAMGVVVDRSNTGLAGDFRLCRSDGNTAKSNTMNLTVTGYPVSKTSTTSCP